MKYLDLILLAMALVLVQGFAFRINENYGTDEQISELSVSNYGYDEKLRNFLENLKTTLHEGNDTLGIPVIDPFVRDELSIVFAHEKIKGTGKLNDMGIVGLAGYTVDKAEVSIFSRKVTIGLTWPYIYSEGLYNFNVVLPNEINAFGNGSYAFTINNLSFETTVKLGIFGGLKVKDMKTSIQLGSLKAEITGLFNDEESSKIISAVLSQMAPQFIQDYQSELTNAINKKAMESINQYLEGKSLKDIKDMLG